MNFLSAIKHATIGYGIRRQDWPPKALLHLDTLGELRWVCGGNQVAPLLGTDTGLSINEEDIKAKDWETI